MINYIYTILTILTVLGFYLATGKEKKILIFFSFWIIIVGILSVFDFFKNTATIPPRLFLFIIPVFAFLTYMYVRTESKNLNLKYLTAIHIVRIPVEIILFDLFLQKKIPMIMTFKGWNYDILMGISAVLVLLMIFIYQEKYKKSILKIWNIMGLVFLLIIVLTAILSAPTPFQQLSFDQPNVAILAFPYSFLPTIIVPIVCFSHLLALKSNK